MCIFHSYINSCIQWNHSIQNNLKWGNASNQRHFPSRRVPLFINLCSYPSIHFPCLCPSIHFPCLCPFIHFRFYHFFRHHYHIALIFRIPLSHSIHFADTIIELSLYMGLANTNRQMEIYEIQETSRETIVSPLDNKRNKFIFLFLLYIASEFAVGEAWGYKKFYELNKLVSQ